ncbi:MAG: LysM peptidoglycan-binding domain-containing protein [Caldilineaceae bacterium]|nr:LysM peptidoglycan-binding domain-containing protein [Caldilineaceae bacterium]
MISKRMSGIILTLAAILLLSACTRERVAEEAGNASEPPQEEPVVMEPDTPQPAATETPLPTPEDTPVPSTVTYEVKPGDTLSTISEKFGTEIQRIREMNLLTTDSLQVGQVLRMPYVPGLTTPEGIPTPTPEPFKYTVQEGDTLLSIALRYDVSLNRILSLNNLRDEHSISIGQELLIPSSSVSTGQPSAQRGAADPALSRQVGTHTVRAGETLASIADQYGVTVAELIAFNSNTITNPHVVRVDTVLLIPGLSAADVSIMNQTLYTVQEGDTLLGISQQFGVTVDALKAANNISNADLLRVGDQLIIPQSTQ